jgi:hypothetical protein
MPPSADSITAILKKPVPLSNLEKATQILSPDEIMVGHKSCPPPPYDWTSFIQPDAAPPLIPDVN